MHTISTYGQFVHYKPLQIFMNQLCSTYSISEFILVGLFFFFIAFFCVIFKWMESLRINWQVYIHERECNSNQTMIMSLCRDLRILIRIKLLVDRDEFLL